MGEDADSGRDLEDLEPLHPPRSEVLGVAHKAGLCTRQSWVQIPTWSLNLFNDRLIFYRMGVKASTLCSHCHD